MVGQFSTQLRVSNTGAAPQPVIDYPGELIRNIMRAASPAAAVSFKGRLCEAPRISSLRGVPAAAPSSFDALALSSQRLQSRGDDAIGMLLVAACVPQMLGQRPDDRLWEQEAIHRAYSTVRLFLQLHESQRSVDPLTRGIEHQLALDIGRILNATRPDSVWKAAFGPAQLCDLVRNLVALFGPACGDISVDCSIERITLSPDRRRASTWRR